MSLSERKASFRLSFACRIAFPWRSNGRSKTLNGPSQPAPLPRAQRKTRKREPRAKKRLVCGQILHSRKTHEDATSTLYRVLYHISPHVRQRRESVSLPCPVPFALRTPYVRCPWREMRFAPLMILCRARSRPPKRRHSWQRRRHRPRSVHSFRPPMPAMKTAKSHCSGSSGMRTWLGLSLGLGLGLGLGIGSRGRDRVTARVGLGLGIGLRCRVRV